MTKIQTIKFNKNTPINLKKIEYGTDWPVVYILNNSKEVYIGETTNASLRSFQHLSNEERVKLKNMTIISNETYNKSVILDLESFLIKYMSGDKKFKLQNGNSGLKNHNYYQKELYQKDFINIWKKLKEKGLINSDLTEIENSDLFKFSPYKSLTLDQYMITNDILETLGKDVAENRESTFIINGGAGTGKTILGIYLMKLLSQIKNLNQIKLEEDEIEKSLFDIFRINNSIEDFKVGLVIPMDNLRVSLKKVFKSIKGLNTNMILSPHEIAKSKEKYDLLIVDEAHRLRRRTNLTQYGTFDENNRQLNLGKNGTELDWIFVKSKYQIFFYDSKQTVRPTDVIKEDFDKLLLKENIHPYFLQAQLRCMTGGEEYINYVDKIFSNNPPKKKLNFENYEFKLYENISEMINDIKDKNKKYGLCRNVAGYSWYWNKKKRKEIETNKKYDIEISGNKYIWNTKTTDWINSPNSIDEIGCIHTIQGFDLNYVGVILGNEIKYDPKIKKIIIDRNNYCDIKGKSGTTDEELLMYILNIYNVMCTRGILGTYIYACDENLRKYLEKYINLK